MGVLDLFAWHVHCTGSRCRRRTRQDGVLHLTATAAAAAIGCPCRNKRCTVPIVLERNTPCSSACTHGSSLPMGPHYPWVLITHRSSSSSYCTHGSSLPMGLVLKSMGYGSQLPTIRSCCTHLVMQFQPSSKNLPRAACRSEARTVLWSLML